jgi:hypothetical protein
MEDKPIAAVSLEADWSGIKAFFKRLVSVLKKVEVRPEISMFDLAETLRKAWGLGRLEGVTTAHPLDIGRFLSIPEASSQLSRSLTLGLPSIQCISLSSNAEICANTRGPVTPYLGSATASKTVNKWMRPVDSSPPLRDLTLILSIRNMMTDYDSTEWNWMTQLVQTRTSLSVGQIGDFAEAAVGGTRAHRYSTRDDPRGSFLNMNVNWSSHLTLSSNLSSDLGSIDRPWSYQLSFLVLNTLVSWKWDKTNQRPPFGYSLVVDTSGLPELRDVCLRFRKSEHSCPSVPPSIEGSNYYLTVENIKYSRKFISSSYSTISLIEEDLASMEAPTDVIREAIRTILVTELSRFSIKSAERPELRRLHTKRSLFDLPEVKKITDRDILWASAQAILDCISLSTILGTSKNRDRGSVYKNLVYMASARMASLLWGTLPLIKCTALTSRWRPGIGQTDSQSNLSWWAWKISCEVMSLSPMKPETTCVFGRGSRPISLVLFSHLLRETLPFSTCSIPTSQNMKRLARLGLLVLSSTSDSLKIKQLLTICKAFRSFKTLTHVAESPEEVIRRLRMSPDESTPIYEPVKISTENYFQVISLESLHSTGKEIQYRDPGRYSEEDMETIWNLKSGLGKSSSSAIWSPLTHQNQEIKSVLIWGIGNGGLTACLPSDCFITYIELSSSLEKLGQSFTTWKPPLMRQNGKLHPASWIIGGDLNDDKCLSEIVKEVQSRVYDTVILDVDRVHPTRRLLARQLLSSDTTISYVRVFLSQADLLISVNSFISMHSVNDRLWVPEVSNYREIIVGGNTAPLCRYTSVGSQLDQVPAGFILLRSDATVTIEDTHDSLLLACIRQFRMGPPPGPWPDQIRWAVNKRFHSVSRREPQNCMFWRLCLESEVIEFYIRRGERNRARDILYLLSLLPHDQ